MQEEDRAQARRQAQALQLGRTKPVLNRSARVGRGPMGRYYSDPVAFAKECFKWPKGESLTEYQEEILRELPLKRKVSVRSLHGAGKTTVLAIAVLWFALTRDLAGVDWKCPTTAGSNRQLKYYLWPEIRKWARRLRWDVIGRGPLEPGHEILKTELNLTHGSAFAVVSNDPYLIEGVHASAVFYVFDEAKAIDAAVFDAAEGAFSGTGEALGLNVSTPGAPEGRFYEIQCRRAGYEDWYPIHINLDRAVTAKRVDQAWAEQRMAQWGADSPLYFNRVLGEFRAEDEEGVIPLAWIEAAVERWKEHTDLPSGEMTQVGVDVARSGNDKTMMALRFGHRIEEVRSSFHQDTMATSGRVVGILTANPQAIAIIDADGLGAGVFDRVREQGHKCAAFHASQATVMRDRSKELGFINVRAAAWWNLRQLLDPANEAAIELPPDDELLGDLVAPHWTVASDARIQIESKLEIRKRIHRSTDRADAVVMAFWQERKKRKGRMFDTRVSSPPPASRDYFGDERRWRAMGRRWG